MLGRYIYYINYFFFLDFLAQRLAIEGLFLNIHLLCLLDLKGIMPPPVPAILPERAQLIIVLFHQVQTEMYLFL